MAAAHGGRATRSPTHAALVRDLATLRQAGITKLRGLRLDGLSTAARLVDETDAGTEYVPQSIEDLLRRAVDRMDGGRYADAAELIFGLATGSRGASPTELRRDAAERMSVAVETFRKDHEKTTLSELAEAILGVCREQTLREARLLMEKRSPADSRLAVQWVERFEDYYRIWTPVYALAADLTAYRSTLNDPERPWDLPGEPGRLVAPLSTEREGYTQEYQAEGYVRFAIFRYATFLQEMHRFQLKRGGMWLLSDAELEQRVADCIYQVGWHTPNNERDDSWMRVTMSSTRGELHLFNDQLMRTTIGEATHAEWQEWATACQCSWDRERSPDDRQSYFAHSGTDSTVDPGCSMHQVIKACSEYVEAIDADWMRIADWYQIEQRPGRGVTGEGLYRGGGS